MLAVDTRETDRRVGALRNPANQIDNPIYRSQGGLVSDDFKNAEPESIYSGPIFLGTDIEHDATRTLTVGPFIAEPGDHYVIHSLGGDGVCKCEVVNVYGPIQQKDK
jgi:hypothetical protein